MAEGWVSRRELADYLKVSTSKVDELVKEGLPSVKLADAPNGARRFRLSAVDQWISGRQGDGEAA